MSPEQAELIAPGRRHPQRHLLAGRAALRAADRHDAAGAARAARGRLRRDPAADHARRSRRSRARGCASSGERLPSIAAPRRTEPARLTRLVRGELDWIVMKALEKDRTRRYETANGFARDIRALPGRRPGGGVPAVGGVPAAEVRPQAPGGAGDGRGVRAPAGRGDGRERRPGVAGGTGAGPSGEGRGGHGAEGRARSASRWRSTR